MKTIYIMLSVMLLSLSTQAGILKIDTPASKDVVFEVLLDTAMKTKPLIVVYENGYYANESSVAEQKVIKAASIHNNSYFFELKGETRPLYFSLVLTNGMKYTAYIGQQLHFEPGDNIRVKVKPSSIAGRYITEFSGTGSAKYRCQNEYRDAVRLDTVKSLPDFSAQNRYNIDNRITRNVKVILDLIKKYRPEMSDYSYNLLKADVIGRYGLDLITDLNLRIDKSLRNKDTVTFKQLSADFKEKFKFGLSVNLPDRILMDSKQYSTFMLKRIACEYRLNFAVLSYPGFYEAIKKTENQTLRDKMIVVFFIKYWSKMNKDYNRLLKDAIDSVKDTACLAKLKQFERQGAGNKAYNFSLPDVQGKSVSLSDFKGKVVFVDFWFTGCTFCKRYFEYVVHDVEKKYQNNPNMVFITVSIDKDRNGWLKSVKDGAYTSPLAVNLYTKGEGATHALIKYYNITTYPRPILIGSNGDILKFTGTDLRKKEGLVSEIDQALQNLE